VRATFAAHGFSSVWRLARVPATLLRRFLPVAIPLPQLPVCRLLFAASGAGKEVVNFEHVAHLPAVSARPVCPLLLLQQSRRAGLDCRVVASARAPVDFIAIVGSASPVPLHVAPDRRFGVTVQAVAADVRPAVPRAVFPSPLAGVAPLPTLVRMATPPPRPSSWPHTRVQRPTRLLTAHGRAVMTPPPDDRVERCDQPALPRPPAAGGHLPDLPVMSGHRCPARVDDRLIATPYAAWVWATVAPQAVEPGCAFHCFQRRPDPGLARFHLQTHLPSPGGHQSLTLCEHFPLRMAPDELIGRADPRRGPPPAGKGLPEQRFQAVQRHLGESGGARAAVGHPCCGRTQLPGLHHPGLSPGVDVASAGRVGVEFASQGGVIAALKPCGDVRLQAPCRLLVDLDLARAHRLPGAASRPTPVAVGLTRRFPCWLERELAYTLLGPVGQRGNAPWTLVGPARCWEQHPTHRLCLAVELQLRHQGQAPSGRAGRLAIAARRALASVVLGDLPDSSPCRGASTPQQFLEPADVRGRTTLCGSVKALWELQDHALDCGPANRLPLRPRTHRVHHVFTPTHPLTFHTPVLTSASPAAFPKAWAS
jgi:hypothetical protein